MAKVLPLLLVGALLGQTVTYACDLHAAIAYGYRSALWLMTPVAQLPDGTLLTRAQLIDLALAREAAALQAQWLLKPAN